MQRLSHFYENTCLARRRLAMDASVVSVGTCPIISRCLTKDFNIPDFRHCLQSVAQQWSFTSRCLAMDVLSTGFLTPRHNITI
jgi:hypothetical protein